METLERNTPLTASPFVKWAGGKGQLLQTIERNLPESFKGYFEPFIGGGAVFFHLVCMGRVSNGVISDSNRDLINCYVTVRDHLEQLLTRLKELQTHARDKDFFYRVARNRYNQINLKSGVEGDVEKAAILLYLNKTCYNGLYRVNKRGGFNVPWGRYKNPSIFDEKNLRAAHAVLSKQGLSILCDDYRTMTKNAHARDFAYLDPPYQPISRTANFTGYTAQSFSWKDQERLAETYRELDAKGCLLMLSNSPRVEKLYAKSHYRIERVKASRAISCVGSKRGPVDELLVMNY